VGIGNLLLLLPLKQKKGQVYSHNGGEKAKEFSTELDAALVEQ